MGVALTGQPGIGELFLHDTWSFCAHFFAGKSVLLMVILILRLHARLPTI